MTAAPGVAERGRLVVLSAPSGAGKTTLARALMRRDPGARFSVSYTTRTPRGSERHGEDYFFVDHAEFRRMIAADEFLEYANVFGEFYGTGRQHVEDLLSAGHSVLLDIDWQGARQVRQRAPDALTVFIFPPSITALGQRLRSRATDSEEAIARRMHGARAEMGHWREFDYLLINDDVEQCADALARIAGGHGEDWRRDRQAAVAARILAGDH